MGQPCNIHPGDILWIISGIGGPYTPYDIDGVLSDIILWGYKGQPYYNYCFYNTERLEQLCSSECESIRPLLRGGCWGSISIFKPW